MIIFQLTLSGHQLRTLVGIQQHAWSEERFRGIPDHFITSVKALERERLITHESPCDCDKPTRWLMRKEPNIGRSGKVKHFHTRRIDPFEITEKGELALKLAAQDLHDFLLEVSGAPGLIAQRRLARRD